ncbi:MAG: type VI secretion system tip protein VgrG [Campylobacteraceae bacterium]|nr:type VI secretion system tip protein VgrG [Campylobacteraceae bacterium]
MYTIMKMETVEKLAKENGITKNEILNYEKNSWTKDTDRIQDDYLIIKEEERLEIPAKKAAIVPVVAAAPLAASVVETSSAKNTVSKNSKPISNMVSSTRDNIHQDIIARLKIMEFPQDFLSKDGKYSVYKLKGESEVNKLYDFTITFVSESAIDISEIADKNVELKLSDQNSVQEKTFCGQVYNVSEKSVVSNKHMYEIKISSPLRYLSLNKRYEIYHAKKASEIIKELFSRYSALLNIKLDLKVDASKSPIREYTTQYGQSDLSFINMLCEEEGYTLIYDYSSCEEYVITLCNLNEHATLIDKKATGAYNFSKKFSPSANISSYYDEYRPSMTFEKEFGKDIKSSIKDNSSTSQLKADIKKQIQKDNLQLHEGSLFKHLERNSTLDSLRQYVKASRFKGRTSELYMSDSISLTITDKVLDKEDDVLITKVIYRATFTNALNEAVDSNDTNEVQYSTTYTAIPQDVIYVPQIKTLKPIIIGVQTARVSKGTKDSPNGANEIDIDDKGRIRVLFHFDENNATSCYLRLSNFFAGNGYGSQFIPRVNSEVLVSFINGDPDKPVVVGSIHNGENHNPYPLPESKTKSQIKTHSIPAHDDQFGYNEIGFEDKKDAEILNLRAQKDFVLHAQNNSYKNIDNNQEEVIGNNEDLTIGGNQTELVKMNKMETIVMAKALSIGAGYQTTVGASKNETVGLSSTEQVGIIKHTIAGKKIEIIVGSSSLVMNADGTIVISGKNVSIEGSKSVVANAKLVDIN